MQHDGLSTSMGGLWRNLDAMATTDPAGGFRTAEYTRSALIKRINLVGYRKRYFVMQLGLRLLRNTTVAARFNPLPPPGISHGGPLGRRTRPAAAHAAPEVPW